ncbi:hypothetical protein COLO4_08784 [Corchorus olitorius]|uniref:ADP-ribosyl cyclase/cyclic ADP-ribose hydrolase n=1 Tax=Corchorus olitorius TaxID=93759 RepID=A0A1R3KEM7_9ROSI|nr:hypothetical protein COLO4_08784 [Corchorus olitorius]
MEFESGPFCPVNLACSLISFDFSWLPVLPPLLKALKDRGINVFFDEEKLEKGEELTPVLLNAIAASKISIIIISKDYASSKSCLTELSKIMECKDSPVGQIVLPIFYRVNPSDVRHHGGPFEESFHQHLINKPKEVERWKAAFTQAGNLKGWHIDGSIFDRSETEYIKVIVEDVIKKLGYKSTSVSEKLVGIKDQIEQILLLIDQEDTRAIGIWGMGGIGKTTLAEAVYNEIVSGSKFDVHYFLQDVHEKSLEKYGMQSLQTELLSKLLGGDIHIDTRFIGSTLIQDRLCNVRVFVVFNDVNNLDQIQRLGVEHFGPGSKIIVTSRDRRVLKNIGVDKLHKVEELDEDDSFKLFCKFAFKQHNPDVHFHYLSMKFLRYAGGNPLALKVLGAALYQKCRDEWESALEKLKEYPEQDIFGPLKISFDGLGRLERNIFLDIACFFIEEDNKDDVTKFLKVFYKGGQFGLSNLVDKCLVDLRPGYPWMHDLLQEMGKDIVRQESEDPGKRSRLWSPEDVYHVLKNNKGTESIKAISADMSQIKELQIHPATFEQMVNLVFIRFYNFYYKRKPGNRLLLANQDLTYLPNVLRYFHWDCCPLKSLPSNFNPHNLVELLLPDSNIEQLWDGDQEVFNLRVINLSCCKNIRKIPNLLGARKLESLRCYGCVSLAELPCMTHLISLKSLNLNGCPISKFPEVPANLEELRLVGTQIEEMPLFIGSLKKLHSLNMSFTNVQNISSSILKLDALQYLHLCDCPNITELNLNMTPIEEELSSSIPRLQSLRKLHVSHCKSLKSLSGLPPWLSDINAEDCTSLERVSFIDDVYQDEDSYAKHLAKQLEKNKLDAYDEFDDLYDEEELDEVLLYILPGSEISDKFENQSRNSSITVKLAGSVSGERFLCFALCLVLNYNKSQFDYNKSQFDHYATVHCEYQLKGTDGFYQNFKKNFKRRWGWNKDETESDEGEYIFVLFKGNMVHRDMQYEESTFDFYVGGYHYHRFHYEAIFKLVLLSMMLAPTLITALMNTIDLQSKHHFIKLPGWINLCSAYGLPISTYFSAVKLPWLMENVDAVKAAIKAGDANYRQMVDYISLMSNPSKLANCRCSFFLGGCLADQHAAMVGQACRNSEAKSIYSLWNTLPFKISPKAAINNALEDYCVAGATVQ